MIKFTVASSPVPYLKGFANAFNKAVNNQIEADAIVIVSQARREHRFQTRTGNLVRSTKYKMSKRDNAATFFIDDVTAPYGKYIHDGFKFWHPDPYLFNAVKRNTKRIYKDTVAAIDRLIKKYHLG